MRYFIALTFPLVSYTCLHAQHPKLDSLTKRFHDTSLNDTIKILLLFGIADELISPEGHSINIEHNLDSAIVVLNQVLELSKKKTLQRALNGAIAIPHFYCALSELCSSLTGLWHRLMRF